MNYLFYVGIILPTLITVCLFLVFIYCWFLQKARKEVLTRRYDPHGKMRRLGLSLEPPPPPDFCRFEVTVATPLSAQLSPAHYGEDNMAYCVSRSPSTDQQNQQQQQQQQQQHQLQQQPNPGRSLYHTYHDSGISAGGLAALSESAIGDEADIEDRAGPPREGVLPAGLAYRTFPDSAVSGLSLGFYLPGDSAHSYHPHHQQQQQHQVYLEDQYHQQQRQPMYHHHQQQQQHQQQQLQHHLVQASVHPTHGVCYGDDTNHPQSPQHYAPPPHHHHHHLQYQENFNNHNNVLHHNDDRLGHMQMTAQIHHHHHQPPSSLSSPQREGPEHVLSAHRRASKGDDLQGFELVSPGAAHPKDVRDMDLTTTETSFGPQGALDIMVTSSSDPRIANLSLPAQQSIVLSCLVQQQQHQHQQKQGQQHHHQQYQQQQHNISSTNTSHHQDSGISEENSGGSGCSNGSNNSSNSADQSASGGSSSSNNTMSSSERPDSQASHSPSTTDSEDSGFRGSHSANHAPLPPGSASLPLAPVPTSRLNKQTNPLLKPMRRPRNKGSRSKNAAPPKSAKDHAQSSSSSAQREPSTVANTDSSNPSSPTPLITLDPQNLSPPALIDSAAFGRGLEMIDMGGRGGPASLRTPDSSPRHSPPDWSGEGRGSRKNSKDGGGGSGGGLPVGDISTHLSWSYAGGGARPEGGASHLRQDMLGYSVV